MASTEEPKKDQGKGAKATVPLKVKNMHIMVPQDLHLRVKMMCVIKDVTLREFTEQALREKLERDEEGLKL